jgi:hypothetical protein
MPAPIHFSEYPARGQSIIARKSTVRVTVGTASSGWNCAGLKNEQVDGSNVGPVVREAKAVQRPKWDDISNSNPMYKNYGIQRIVLVERRCARAPLKFCQSAVQDSADSPSSNQGEESTAGLGGHLGYLCVIKTAGKFRRSYNGNNVTHSQ